MYSSVAKNFVIVGIDWADQTHAGTSKAKPPKPQERSIKTPAGSKRGSSNCDTITPFSSSPWRLKPLKDR